MRRYKPEVITVTAKVLFQQILLLLYHICNRRGYLKIYKQKDLQLLVSVPEHMFIYLSVKARLFILLLIIYLYLYVCMSSLCLYVSQRPCLYVLPIYILPYFILTLQ